MRKFAREKGAVAGLIIVSLLLLAALVAPWISPFDPYAQQTGSRLKPPLWRDAAGSIHIMGTDSLGRDIFSRVIHGSRVSLTVVMGVMPISTVIGVGVGLSSGYFGGHTDDVLMRLVDIQMAIPFMLLVLTVMSIIGPSLVNVIILLGLTSWTAYARQVRAEALTIREMEYVLAAQATGAQAVRILLRHVLPNVASTIIIVASLQVPHVIISEATLSFLGLGVPPPNPSWGGMVSEGRQYLWVAWWLSTFPGLAIMLTVLGFNLIGDRLRDLLDPRVGD